jgi:undecaprenyl diphosphate synthase
MAAVSRRSNWSAAAAAGVIVVLSAMGSPLCQQRAGGVGTRSGCSGYRQEVELADLDPTRIPRHVAVVMDGNGRWAQRRGLPRTEGHAAGEEALMDTIWGADSAGLGYLTVYAFSTENWKRPVDEVRYLMGFNERLLLTRRDEIHARNIRMQFLGRRDWRVPKRILRRIDETIELTGGNTGMVVSMAFNYGGRAELVDAVRAIVDEGVAASKINEKAIAAHLYDPRLPDPELVVRTSGELRTSNFLMWQSAYSELVFTDTLWPDFRRGHLYECIAEYQRRDRRFGGLNPEGS